MSVESDVRQAYGLNAVLADSSKVLPDPSSVSKDNVRTHTVSSTPIPNTPLAHRIQQLAKEKLPRQTFHHSMRVYHYGIAIARQCFPEWEVSKQGSPAEETFFLTAMLHDIGTTDEARKKTVMSFELHGGLMALDVLQNEKSDGEPSGSARSPQAQAESICESIVRHQDIETRGYMSRNTQLIQLATIFDNAGKFEEYVNRDTIENVSKEWPREGWLDCFANVIKKEMEEKPWSTTTRLGVQEFPEMVMANDLMRPWE